MILKLMYIWLVLLNFIIDDARSHEREICMFCMPYIPTHKTLKVTRRTL
jgi:hypothetical protein